MKTLFIVRHAKSSWEDFTVSDHDRDLLDVGIKRTQKVAGYLRINTSVPGIIISSSALRARKTAEILAGGLGYPVENIKISPSLYGCDETDIFAELYALSDDFKSAMIVGHNPAFTDFANYFLKQRHRLDNLPTSGVVVVKLKTKHWINIHDAKASLILKLFPKKLT